MNTTRALLDAYYAAFNAGDWNGMLALLSDDVAHDINQGRRELGKPAFALFLERMATSYQEELVDLTHCISDDGTRAATEFVVLGRYVQTDEGLPPASGQNYRLPGGAFFEVRANKITRVTNYYNLEDWLAQVRRA
jgi:steroid delta-isomerase-like uncharacterized protein